MIFTYLALAVFLYMVIYLRSEYDALPDEMPVHYGFDGKPDQIGSKSMMWVLVGVGGLTAALMTAIPFVEEVKEGALVLGVTHLLCQLLFFYIIYQSIKIARGEAEGLGKEFFFLIILVIILPIGLALLGDKLP